MQPVNTCNFGNISQLHMVISKTKRKKSPENGRFSGVWEKRLNLAQLMLHFHLLHTLWKKRQQSESNCIPTNNARLGIFAFSTEMQGAYAFLQYMSPLDLSAGSISLKGHRGTSCFNTKTVVINENFTGFHAIPGSKINWLFHVKQTNSREKRNERARAHR